MFVPESSDGLNFLFVSAWGVGETALGVAAATRCAFKSGALGNAILFPAIFFGLAPVEDLPWSKDVEADAKSGSTVSSDVPTG